ncbi:NAD(P)/FAD-dependent oxidoreductase [Humisphaera borealis]|nr:NAD(P)/FAD-dependent oxidoreductase [Humisphaera borealis]
MADSPRKRLIVIGAGFAGLNLVKGLRGLPLDIILVDKHNYHCFQPLLYQVATAGLSPADIAYPIRRVFRDQKNVRVVLGEVERIDLANKTVSGGEASVSYDYLAICVGVTHSYFGNEKWQPMAPGLKSIDDATEIRRKVLLAFEAAELEQDEASRRAKLTFVVVGGGPTGVEMAGALREIAAVDIQRDFRNIDTTTSRIMLLQGGDRLLPSMDPKLSARALKDLQDMGVEVRLNCRVTGVDETGVWVGDEQLPADNIIWAAGVQAPAMLRTLGVPTDRSGRIVVGPDLSIPGHPEVFVLGDAGAITDAKTNQPVPGLAPAAMQMGKFAAKVLRAELSGQSADVKARPGFSYHDKGTMATIGKRRAVADIKGWHITGLVAWLMWSVVHVMFLISFRTKLFVMAGWVYDYIMNNREARLITGKFRLHVVKPRGGATETTLLQTRGTSEQAAV